MLTQSTGIHCTKKCHFTHFFLGQTLHFFREKRKIRTNNQHLRKAGSFVIILSLRLGVQYIKKGCNNFVNAMAVKCTLLQNLAKPPYLSIWLKVKQIPALHWDDSSDRLAQLVISSKECQNILFILEYANNTIQWDFPSDSTKI